MRDLYHSNLPPTDPPSDYFLEHFVTAYRPLNNGSIMLEIRRISPELLSTPHDFYTFQYNVWVKYKDDSLIAAPPTTSAPPTYEKITCDDPLCQNNHGWSIVAPKYAPLAITKEAAKIAAELDAKTRGLTFDEGSNW